MADFLNGASSGAAVTVGFLLLIGVLGSHPGVDQVVGALTIWAGIRCWQAPPR